MSIVKIIPILKKDWRITPKGVVKVSVPFLKLFNRNVFYSSIIKLQLNNKDIKKEHLLLLLHSYKNTKFFFPVGRGLGKQEAGRGEGERGKEFRVKKEKILKTDV